MQMQKWPKSVSLIRHGESAFNAKKNQDVLGMAEFRAKYKEEFAIMNAHAVYTGKFPSVELRKMAIDLLPFVAPEYSDFDTELTETGYRQAVKTGERLPENLELPNAIYVSPYKRTRQTLEGLMQGWPELKAVRLYEDERIREQEHGKRTMIGDAMVYFVLHPDHALHYKYSTKYEYKHEGGESLLDVKDRVRSMVSTLIREHSSLTHSGAEAIPENVMMVTHHLVILAARANLERWNREKFIHEDENNRPVNCGVTIYKGHPVPSDARNLGKLELDQYNLKLY